MADCARRNANSVSPLAVAAWAWVKRDSTVIGGSGAGGLAGAGTLAGAAKAVAEASSSAAKKGSANFGIANLGIEREIMAGTIRYFAGREPCVIDNAGPAYASQSAQARAIKSISSSGLGGGPEFGAKSGHWFSLPACRQIDGDKILIAGKERGDPVLVLASEQGTGGIDQPPTRSGMAGSIVQQPILNAVELGQPL